MKQAVLQFVIMFCIGALQLRWGHPTAAYILFGLATFLLVSALIAPNFYEILIGLVTRLVRAIVNTTGAIMLGTIYYTLFTLIAAFRGALGRDPLNRTFPGKSDSNWIVRGPQKSDTDTYAKLYSNPHADESTR